MADARSRRGAEGRAEARPAAEAESELVAGGYDAVIMRGKVFGLENSDLFYRIFFESMNEGGVVVDDDGRILSCNPTFSDFVGKGRAELVGTSFYELLKSPCRVQVGALLGSGLSGIVDARFESEIGSGMRALVSVRPIAASGKRIACVVVTDIRKQSSAAFAALKSDEDFKKSILDSIPAEVAVLALDGTIVEVNEQWMRFAKENCLDPGGNCKAAAVGANYLEVCAAGAAAGLDGARAAHAGIMSILDGSSSEFNLEYRCDSPSERRWYLMRAKPLGSDRRGVVISHTPITQLKAAEEAARKALQEREVLLRELSHRTKNNMAIMTAMLNLQAQAAKDDRVRSALLETQGRINSMALVHQMLYDTGSFDTIDLIQYLHELAILLVDQSREARLELRFSGNEAELPVNMRIAIPAGMILNELVTNSIKYAYPEGGTGAIGLDVDRVGEEIEVAISDDGRGLPESFDPRKDGDLGMITIFSLGEGQLGGSVAFERLSPGTRCSLRFRP
jgi:PAS domain S-box-containing protein